MDKKEQEEITLFLKSLLEDRIKIKKVMFDFELWGIYIDSKDDLEAGKMLREYVNLCRSRQPEKAKPETFQSREALKGMAHAYSQRKSYADRTSKRRKKGQPKEAKEPEESEDLTDENPF